MAGRARTYRTGETRATCESGKASDNGLEPMCEGPIVQGSRVAQSPQEILSTGWDTRSPVSNTGKIYFPKAGITKAGSGALLPRGRRRSAPGGEDGSKKKEEARRRQKRSTKDC